jgi:4-alpha-glucanotransferase
MTHPLDRRCGGMLCPVSALPGPLPRGTLGDAALRFLDFLVESGLRVWQVLPLNPPDRYGSPYHSHSVFALDASLVADSTPGRILEHARRDGAAFERFRAQNAFWLDDYVRFELARAIHGADWSAWPVALRDRDADALDALDRSSPGTRDALLATQFLAFARWERLRREANARGVQLLGDLPLYPAHASADVWSQPRWFQLDAQGAMSAVAGVPPDYFSADGQRWGNPLYDWRCIEADGFRWWVERLRHELTRFDLVRVDHFRGFEACWEIPASEPTAINGHWVQVPGERLFDTLLARLGRLPLVAEDLGLITPEVTRLRERYGLPGMKVLQFAFDGGADNPYLPHAHVPDSVVYTGTHDNDTTLSWFQGLSAGQQSRVIEYLGYPYEPMPLPMLRAAFASVASLAIVPMQDVLGLGRGQRMNTPGTVEGNWGWRFDREQLSPDIAKWLRRAIECFGRI